MVAYFGIHTNEPVSTVDGWNQHLFQKTVANILESSWAESTNGLLLGVLIVCSADKKFSPLPT